MSDFSEVGGNDVGAERISDFLTDGLKMLSALTTASGFLMASEESDRRSGRKKPSGRTRELHADWMHATANATVFLRDFASEIGLPLEVFLPDTGEDNE